MRNTVRRAYAVYALIFAFFAGLAFMMYTYIVHGREYVTNRVNTHLYSYRQLTNAGAVYDRNKVKLVCTENDERVFGGDSVLRKAMLHCVGDTEGYISTGVQTLYRSYLIGYDFIDGVYKTVRDGTGNDITLTVDSDICRTAYQALNGNKGTVGVYNYNTGEIVCMVSSPSYDPDNIPDDMDTNESYDGVYLNRLLSGLFTPGSTFKVVTAISAIENIDDIYKRSFNCTGSYETKDGTVICSSVHGKVSFKEGLNRSCNCVFAQLANELGKKKLTATAEELGFNRELTACGVETAKSIFSVKKADSAELGWAGIGQSTTYMNPCHSMMLMGAIANGGEAVTPRLISEKSSKKASTIFEGKATEKSQITIDSTIAEQMKSLLRSNVTDWYGDDRFKGLEMCGKTGTAEIDGALPHAWFVGFSQREDLPYAIVVAVENGGSASKTAIPIAASVMAKVDERF